MSVIDLLVCFLFLGLAAIWLLQTTADSWSKDSATAAADSWTANDLVVQRIQDLASCFSLTVQGVRILVFYPVSRSNFLHWLFGVDYQSLIRYHILFGNGVVFLSWASAALNLTLWAAKGEHSSQFTDLTSFHDPRLDPTGTWSEENCSGLVATGLLTVLYVSSLEWFRKNYYHAWKIIHVFTAFAFISFSLMYSPNVAFYILPGILLYLLDKTLRGWQCFNSTTLTPGQDIVISSKGIVTISLDWAGGSKMKPGQTIYLTVPEIHKFQAHPFSIASVSDVEIEDPKQVVIDLEKQSISSHSPSCSCSRVQTLVHIKVGGEWTSSLLNRVKDESKGELVCQVEGPYDYLPCLPTHNVVVMVAGGIGITPILGILRCWIAQPHLAPEACYLVWSSRSIEDLSLLDSALVDLASADSSTKSWLRLHVHFTGKHEKIVASFDREKDATQPTELRAEDSETSSDSYFTSISISSISTETSNFCGPSSSSTPQSETCKRKIKPLLIPVASNHPILYLVLASLCFLGAYAGLQIPAYYDAQLKSHTLNWFVLGLLRVSCLIVGSCCPPLLGLIALASLRKSLVSSSRSQSLGSDAAKSMVYSSVQEINGGLHLKCKASGFCVPIDTRRPDLRSLLSRIKATHDTEIEIPVLVGGREALLESSRNEIEEQNSQKGAYLRLQTVAVM